MGLHASRQLSDKVLRSPLLLSVTSDLIGGGPRFLATSPCRHGGRTVSSPLECGDRRTVSEGSDLVSRSAFPADCPHPAIVTAIRGTQGSSDVPANGRFLLRQLRHLKRVIVTPAVYRSFAPLNRVFRYRHWAGFSRHTNPFGLAATYVFSKQSELPCH